jgi:hypothetical protein
MTQGRDGISLAPVGALRLMGVTRRLSVVAAVFALAALVAVTAGTSYAQTDAKTSKDAHHHKGAVLLDNVTVTNYGAAFGGSLATFMAGRGPGDAPKLLVKGTNTLLGAGTGPAGVSVSSLDAHIGVTVPIDLLDMSGFGGFPNTLACTGAGTPVPCCTGALTGVCGPGTGFVAIFSQGATKNSAPESFIGTRNVTFDNVAGPGLTCTGPGTPLACCTGPNAGTCEFNTSGVDTSQGIAFEDPFDGVNPGRDVVAIANTLPINFFSTIDLLDGTNGGAACNAFGSGACTGPGTPLACCTGPATGTCAGMTVGTISEFDIRNQIKPGFNDNVAPFNNSPVCTLPAVAIPPDFDEPPTHCPLGSAGNTTIGGCLTFLLGPVGLAFDQTGFLFAVNEAAVAQGGPGFITVYQPDSFGDMFPTSVVGLLGPTAGAFVDPAKITVLSDSDFNDDVIFVTDVGDNSIKIFDPFANFDDATLFFEGEQLGTIHGGSTKLKRPEGLAVNSDNGTLYVVNNNKNSLEMFTDIGEDEGGGDIPPTLIVQGRNTKLNFPVDVALPAFTPSSRETESGHAN